MTTTLTPFLDRYFAGRRGRGELEPVTARKQRRKMDGLDRSFGRRPVGHFGATAVDRWLETIGDLAPSSRRQYLCIVRGFGRWLLAQGHVRTDPTAHVGRIPQPRKVPATLTDAEVARLLAASPSARTDAILWLLVGCGCRTIEVSRLRLEDYDPRAGVLRLTGKGGNERAVPVPTAVAVALDAYLDEAGRVSGPLIRSEPNPTRGLLPATIGCMVRDLMVTAGVKARPLDGRSAHGLRRTAASDVMDRSGGNIRVVQEMLGHASVETTARHYLRQVPMAQLRAAMEGRSYDVGDDAEPHDLSPPALRAA